MNLRYDIHLFLNLFMFQFREELAGNSSYAAEKGLSAGSTYPVLLKK